MQLFTITNYMISFRKNLLGHRSFLKSYHFRSRVEITRFEHSFRYRFTTAFDYLLFWETTIFLDTANNSAIRSSQSQSCKLLICSPTRMSLVRVKNFSNRRPLVENCHSDRELIGKEFFKRKSKFQ